jgi:hypothetical protein
MSDREEDYADEAEEAEDEFVEEEEEDAEPGEYAEQGDEAAASGEAGKDKLSDSDDSEEEKDNEDEDIAAEEAEDPLNIADAASSLASRPRAAAPRSAAATRSAPKRTKVDPLVKFSMTSRDAVIVRGDDRITQNLLTRTEAVKLCATRTAQIAANPMTFAENCDSTNPKNKALHELYTRRCPLLLYRRMGADRTGNNIYEEWDPKLMALPPLD